jgi:hypothetical protein
MGKESSGSGRKGLERDMPAQVAKKSQARELLGSGEKTAPERIPAPPRAARRRYHGGPTHWSGDHRKRSRIRG